MSFENQVLGLELDAELLGGNPAFRSIILRDNNILSRNTKSRRLEAPNEPMRIIHRRLIRYLRNLGIEYLHATACRPGDSPLKNVERHKANRFFYLIDFRHAYRSVQLRKLAGILCRADPEITHLRKEARAFLEQYCISVHGGLATGAPASPDLFNLYCNEAVDKPLAVFCSKFGLTYTRYLDDLTFSANHPISQSMRREIRHIAEGAGFEINHWKSEVKDLAKGPIVVNGVGLQNGGRIFIPRSYLRYVRGLLYKGLRGRFELRPKIEGAVGTMLSCSNRKRPNKTERKVLEMHRRFRTLVKIACR